MTMKDFRSLVFSMNARTGKRYLTARCFVTELNKETIVVLTMKRTYTPNTGSARRLFEHPEKGGYS